MLPTSYFRFVFAFLMSVCMSFVMAGVLTFINLGLPQNFAQIWFIAWGKAFIVAYPCVLFIAPLASKLTAKICKGAAK